jgi:chromosome segregation ATPase
MAKKYLKNSKGIVRAITTDNLQLEKPLLNENYDIEVHNRNMDKLDTTIQGLKGKVDNIDTTIQDLGDRIDNVGNIVEELELKAQKVTIIDEGNYFASDNVEGALNELATELNGQRLRGINIANSIIDKLEG